MGQITKYRNLSNEELLNRIEDARAHSPIIEELATRLETAFDPIKGDANRRVECPVCEANLEADFDFGNEMFTIRIDRQ